METLNKHLVKQTIESSKVEFGIVREDTISNPKSIKKKKQK